MIHHHIYNIKPPLFYICNVHKHTHNQNSNIDCVIHSDQCCENAVPVKEYNQCFIITTTNNTTNGGNCLSVSSSLPVLSNELKSVKSNNKTNNNGNNTTTAVNSVNGNVGAGSKPTEYIIFDPTIWREQSYNHFISFVRAIIMPSNMINERYKRFENSNFSISNIKKYKSGKESIIRTAVTGFETKGLYQTSTISCSIPYYAVIIPTQLYEMLELEGYDLDYVMIKRDPSILTTCLYVCVAYKNPDPTINVIIISDQQSKGFNQDQDGDKNAVYLIRKTNNDYITTQSYEYKIAKLELALQFRNKCTLVATPRYRLSETTLLLMERNRNDLLDTSKMPNSIEYFKRTHKHGVRFVNDASSGYLRDEYDDFQRNLMHLNAINELSFITIDDLTLRSNKLHSIITSGAKGNHELLNMFLSNITNMPSLSEYKKNMIDLCNKYIVSNQDLSRNGRKQFIALYASQDLITFNENIYINKIFYANYSFFASAGMFMFNEVSLELFFEDLLNN